MFHNHDWKEIERTFTGTAKLGDSWGYSSEEIERFLFGVTTILWECQDKSCRKLRKEEMLGRSVPPLKERGD